MGHKTSEIATAYRLEQYFDGIGDRAPSSLAAPHHHAFISHASEDKEDLVRPLAEKLVQAGFDIWYDEHQLTVGDSLRRSIDRGLANARFGIVVLSPSFFAKNWPQYELDGLVAKEMEGNKVSEPPRPPRWLLGRGPETSAASHAP